MNTETRLDPTVFEEAAGLLADRGWTQGDYCVDGKHCANGALAAVLAARAGVDFDILYAKGRRGDDKYLKFLKPVEGDGSYSDFLADFVGAFDFGVVDWNDEDGRVESEVIDALRGAAESLRD